MIDKVIDYRDIIASKLAVINSGKGTKRDNKMYDKLMDWNDYGQHIQIKK